MRIARCALEQVRDYAAERGCTIYEPEWPRFISPDRKRHIRISEVQPDKIFIEDTAAWRVILPREGRPSRLHKNMGMNGDKPMGGQFGPLEAKESEL